MKDTLRGLDRIFWAGMALGLTICALCIGVVYGIGWLLGVQP